MRSLARPTHDYTVLLAETTHPDVMRDALDRDQAFGLLWVRAAVDPSVARLVRSEAEDLWAGDVPLFTTLASSRDLRTESGRLIEGLLPESGVDRVRRTMAALGPAHLERQLWITSAHLATRSIGTGPIAPDAGPAADAGDEEPCERALVAAQGIADRLEATSYRNAGRVGWLGLDFSASGRWSVAPLGVELYNGYAGVALFLAQLVAVTGADRYAESARGVLELMTGYVQKQLGGRLAQQDQCELGAFNGLSGVALAFASCAVLLDDKSFAEPVTPILEFAADRLRADEFDLTSGAAGILAVAESLAADYGAPAHQLADRCANILISGAVPADPGLAWPGPAPTHLLGFSHGVAGIAWALHGYARRTGDLVAETVASRALRHEHAAYDERMANWPDHRLDTPSDQYTWCHGAPSIGLARASSLATRPSIPEELADLAHLADLRRAMRAPCVTAATQITACAMANSATSSSSPSPGTAPTWPASSGGAGPRPSSPGSDRADRCAAPRGTSRRPGSWSAWPGSATACCGSPPRTAFPRPCCSPSRGAEAPRPAPKPRGPHRDGAGRGSTPEHGPRRGGLDHGYDR